MNGDSQPTNAELLQAIMALHAFTEAGLQRLDSRIDRLDAKFDARFNGLDARVDRLDARVDGLDTKLERLRYDMNRRFDHVYVELDDIKARVTRLELRPT